jgi:hypothetical protein
MRPTLPIREITEAQVEASALCRALAVLQDAELAGRGDGLRELRQTHDAWVRATAAVLPLLKRGRSGQPANAA